MKEFWLKTRNLWMAIFYIALSAVLGVIMLFLIERFFSSAGGSLKVIALNVCLIFVLYSFKCLYKFIVSSFKKENFLYSLLALAIVSGIVGPVLYLRSDSYRYKQIHNQVKSGELTGNEAINSVKSLLFENTPGSRKTALKCIDYLSLDNTPGVCYGLGEIYFDQDRYYNIQDYIKAEKYYKAVLENLPLSPENSDLNGELDANALAHVYENLGDIYANGWHGEVDKEKAVEYYKAAHKFINIWDKEKISEKLATLEIES